MVYYVFIMLNLFLFLNFIKATPSLFIEDNCGYISDSEECIKSTYCAWCNTTNFFNNTSNSNESCIFKNTCSNYFNDTNCLINPNHYQICNFTIMVVNLLLIFTYLCIDYTLIRMSHKFYDAKNNPRYNFFINLFITLIVFVPSFTLWFLESSYYLPYLLG